MLKKLCIAVPISILVGCAANGALTKTAPKIFTLDRTIGLTREEAQEQLFSDGSKQFVRGRFVTSDNFRQDGFLEPCINESRAAELTSKYAGEIKESLAGGDGRWIARARNAGEFGWNISVKIAELSFQRQTIERFDRNRITNVSTINSSDSFAGKCVVLYLRIRKGGLGLTNLTYIASGDIMARVENE